MARELDPRAFKDAAYGIVAEVGHALSSPRRLEILDLLIQGPRTVDDLARATGRSVASTSQHLQVLRRAGLVERRALGTAREYRVAEGVPAVFVALRRLAALRRPALREVEARFHAEQGAPEALDLAALRERMDAGDVVLLDVRPRREYDHGHIPGAASIPIDELPDRLAEVPEGPLVVVTCRGPFCTWADEAVRLLRSRGRAAVRLEGGVAEWAVAADGPPPGGGAGAG